MPPSSSAPADQPIFGAYAPNAMQRAGLAIGRALPRGRAGLRLAGAARPLALFGLNDAPVDVRVSLAGESLRLRLRPRDNLSEKRLFMTPQCFDPDELAALKPALSPGAVFMDIGANAGAYALFAAKAGGPDAQVIAVEPQSEMRARLAFNAAANGLSNIEIRAEALADYEGESLLRLAGPNKGAASLEKASGGEAVRVTTLPALMAALSLDRVDAAKIDVEGGEAAILGPLFAEIHPAAWPKLLILERPELNAPGGPAPIHAVALALSKGYRLALETRMNAVLHRAQP